MRDSLCSLCFCLLIVVFLFVSFVVFIGFLCCLYFFCVFVLFRFVLWRLLFLIVVLDFVMFCLFRVCCILLGFCCCCDADAGGLRGVDRRQRQLCIRGRCYGLHKGLAEAPRWDGLGLGEVRELLGCILAEVYEPRPLHCDPGLRLLAVFGEISG